MLLTGAHWDKPDSRDYQFLDAPMMGGASPTRSSVSLLPYHEFRVQKSNSCIAYAIHQGVQIHGAVRFAMGLAPKMPLLGPLFGYTGARILSSPPTEGHSIPDIGSYTRFNLKWMRDRGIVSEETWPEIPENISKVPPFDVFKKGGLVSLDKFYSIPNGPGATDQLIAALRLAEKGECSPPNFVMQVGDSYANSGKNIYTGPKPGESLAGHGQTILVWDEARAAFGVASTWGTDLGDDGIFWISEEFMNTQTGDKWVTQVAPMVRP